MSKLSIVKRTTFFPGQRPGRVPDVQSSIIMLKNAVTSASFSESMVKGLVLYVDSVVLFMLYICFVQVRVAPSRQSRDAVIKEKFTQANNNSLGTIKRKLLARQLFFCYFQNKFAVILQTRKKKSQCTLQQTMAF